MIVLVGCSADKIYPRDVNILMFVVPLEAHATMGVAGPGGGTIVDLIAAMRCSVFPFLKYFTPKSSTQRVNVVFYLWFQSPGVCCSST